MKTNTEINAWEIRDNKYNLMGNAKSKSEEQTDIELVIIRVGEEEAIVNGTDLIVAVENALHSNREEYNHHGRPRHQY